MRRMIDMVRLRNLRCNVMARAVRGVKLFEMNMLKDSLLIFDINKMINCLAIGRSMDGVWSMKGVWMEYGRSMDAHVSQMAI